MKSDNIFLALWTHVVYADGLKRVLHMTHSSRAKKTAATKNCLDYTANVYRQTTDKLMFKSVISTVR